MGVDAYIKDGCERFEALTKAFLSVRRITQDELAAKIGMKRSGLEKALENGTLRFKKVLAIEYHLRMEGLKIETYGSRKDHTA